MGEARDTNAEAVVAVVALLGGSPGCVVGQMISIDAVRGRSR